MIRFLRILALAFVLGLWVGHVTARPEERE
jgi:hypothetical protein